jgi:outer membrane protein assembly factor BamB
MLPNGNLMVFDNGYSRGWSRVVEYDPSSGEIVWEYKASDPYEFFSRGRGSCQRLPNGNTLITESAKGRVFETTPDGKLVWEFMNPSRQLDRRGTFYRSMRYERKLVDALMTSGRR